MNVTLKPFDFAQAVARAGLGTDGQFRSQSGPAAAPGAGFQKALGQALGAVSKSQNDATAMQREVSSTTRPSASSRRWSRCRRRRSASQATLQVRNRLVQAYSEIMSMQV